MSGSWSWARLGFSWEGGREGGRRQVGREGGREGGREEGGREGGREEGGREGRGREGGRERRGRERRGRERHKLVITWAEKHSDFTPYNILGIDNYILKIAITSLKLHTSYDRAYVASAHSDITTSSKKSRMR